MLELEVTIFYKISQLYGKKENPSQVWISDDILKEPIALCPTKLRVDGHDRAEVIVLAAVEPVSEAEGTAHV
jgi:hypothetical protein